MDQYQVSKYHPVICTRICVITKATLRVLRWPARSERPAVTAQHYVVLRANKIGQKTRQSHPGVTSSQALAHATQDRDNTTGTIPISVPKPAEDADKIEIMNNANAFTEDAAFGDESSATTPKPAEDADKSSAATHKPAKGLDKLSAATPKSAEELDKSSAAAPKSAEGLDKCNPRYAELRDAACAVLRWADPHYRWTGFGNAFFFTVCVFPVPARITLWHGTTDKYSHSDWLSLDVLAFDQSDI